MTIVARGEAIDGVLTMMYTQLIDALLFDEEMAEAAFMADPTPGNHENLLWARSRVENMKGPCQRGGCGHSGEVHKFVCLVDGCACEEYTASDVFVTGCHPVPANSQTAPVAA
jgi:hypothetical protein